MAVTESEESLAQRVVDMSKKKLIIMTNLTNETVDLITNIFFGTCLAIFVGILLFIIALKAHIWWDENKERWQ